MFKANCGSFPGLRSEVPQTDGLKQQKRISLQYRGSESEIKASAGLHLSGNSGRSHPCLSPRVSLLVVSGQNLGIPCLIAT